MTKKTQQTEDTPYILSKWRDYKRYACRLCAFDTLEREKFVSHFASIHPPLEVIDMDPPAAPLEELVEE